MYLAVPWMKTGVTPDNLPAAILKADSIYGSIASGIRPVGASVALEVWPHRVENTFTVLIGLRSDTYEQVKAYQAAVEGYLRDNKLEVD